MDILAALFLLFILWFSFKLFKGFLGFTFSFIVTICEIIGVIMLLPVLGAGLLVVGGVILFIVMILKAMV